MTKEWICGRDGQNLKFKRETLLNWAMNRWALNKAHSVGPTSELIRLCSPKTFDEWEAFYFANAVQKKRNGIKVTREYIEELGRKLYVKLSEVVRNELMSITEEECIDYAYNLVLNRTYEGYLSEIDTVYGQLEAALATKIQPAPDDWDRTYNVDFYIAVGTKYIGIQIKPTTFTLAPNRSRWEKMQEASHKRFQDKFGGRVFFVYSVKSGDKKRIYNPEIIDEIVADIGRLQGL